MNHKMEAASVSNGRVGVEAVTNDVAFKQARQNETNGRPKHSRGHVPCSKVVSLHPDANIVVTKHTFNSLN